MADEPKKTDDPKRAMENPATSASESANRGMRAAADTAAQMHHAATSAATDVGRKAMESGVTGMAEFSRMFSELKMPGMPDMDAFLSAHRRNMEVLSAANRVALEGAQAVARRHMEIMQQSMAELTDTMRQLASAETPQAKAAKQADLMKAGYERAVAHLKELADLIQRSNSEALGLLNQRFAEAMDEVKSVVDKAGANQAGKDKA